MDSPPPPLPPNRPQGGRMTRGGYETPRSNVLPGVSKRQSSLSPRHSLDGGKHLLTIQVRVEPLDEGPSRKRRKPL